MFLLAFAASNSPLVIWSLVMVAGFALLYSREYPVRLAGSCLMLASALVTCTGGYGNDAEGWVLLIPLAIIFAIFRPKWLLERPHLSTRADESGSV